MSTRVVQTRLVFLCAVLAVACVDPKKDLTEWQGRVPDTPPQVTCDGVGRLADLTGQFYLALDPKPLRPGAFLHYIVDLTMTDIAAPPITVDVTLRPLDFMTRQPVAGVEPDAFADLAVNPDGTFVIPLGNVTIPGAANAVLPGSPTTLTAASKLDAVIASPDHFYGDATGSATTGTELDGSTFGALRIENGTLGDALPAPAGECRVAAPPDAGVPDAGVPDAAPVDAAAVDAPAIDAAE